MERYSNIPRVSIFYGFVTKPGTSKIDELINAVESGYFDFDPADKKFQSLVKKFFSKDLSSEEIAQEIKKNSIQPQGLKEKLVSLLSPKTVLENYRWYYYSQSLEGIKAGETPEEVFERTPRIALGVEYTGSGKPPSGPWKEKDVDIGRMIRIIEEDQVTPVEYHIDDDHGYDFGSIENQANIVDEKTKKIINDWLTKWKSGWLLD